MHTLTKSQLKSIQGGNFAIPMVAAAGLGACTNVLAWAVKNTIQGNTEEFNNFSNYVVEATIGATIASFGAIGFVFATS